ncbi:MAG: hypothetical protein F6K41_11560 [Symploca sp. SIO3E6]|nr:hypothetical protein [Caldora sp. SIO3E6]
MGAKTFRKFCTFLDGKTLTMINMLQSLLSRLSNIANIVMLFPTVLIVFGIANDSIILPTYRQYKLKPITVKDMEEVCSKPKEFMADSDYEEFQRDHDELNFITRDQYNFGGEMTDIFDVTVSKDKFNIHNPIIPAFRWNCQYFYGTGIDPRNKYYGLNFDKFCLRSNVGNAVPVVHHPRKMKIYCTPRPVRS